MKKFPKKLSIMQLKLQVSGYCITIAMADHCLSAISLNFMQNNDHIEGIVVRGR